MKPKLPKEISERFDKKFGKVPFVWRGMVPSNYPDADDKAKAFLSEELDRQAANYSKMITKILKLLDKKLANQKKEMIERIEKMRKRVNTDFKIQYVSKTVYSDSEINARALEMAENLYFNSAWVLGIYSKLDRELEVKEAEMAGLPRNAIKEVNRHCLFVEQGIDRGLDYVIFLFNRNDENQIKSYNQALDDIIQAIKGGEVNEIHN